jgi:hypothetical protein
MNDSVHEQHSPADPPRPIAAEDRDGIAPFPWLPFAVLLVFGLALRVFSCWNTAVVNPDGAIYIHQARALYYGVWNAVNSCTISYLSLYPVFIAGVFPVAGDWLVAARIVSIFFGAAVLWPLFLLSRRFFPLRIAILVTLIYAVVPALVDGSVEIVRDPVYWFLAVSGLYLFTRAMEEDRTVYLLSGSIVFIIATSLRIEAFLFILVSAICLLIAGPRGRLRRTMIFLLPLIAAVAAFFLIQIVRHPDEIYWYRLKEIPGRLYWAVHRYQELRGQLNLLIAQPPAGIPYEFFHSVRSNIWLIGFGAVLKHAVEAFFFPFFLLALVGLTQLRTKIRDRRVAYFAALAASAFVLLYFYVFTNWSLENRYFALALFPSFIFFGLGLEKIFALLEPRISGKRITAFSLILALILLVALPKDLKPTEADKIVFKTIGEKIAAVEGNEKAIDILVVGQSSRWIHFYANRHFRGAPCPDKYSPEVFADIEAIVGASDGEFIQNLKSRQIRYLVWEEKRWPAGRFDFLQSPHERDFIHLGTWEHPDTGRIMLFKVR